jgi:hypothetical protein
MRLHFMKAPSLASKYKTKVEVNGSGKHPSLLLHGNNYGHEKFYSTGPSMLNKRSNLGAA